jgi:dihydropteroate synthase
VEGLRPTTVFFDGIDVASRNALTKIALLQGLELVTGDEWVVLSGPTASLAGLSRSTSEELPRSLKRDLGTCLDRVIHRPNIWRTNKGTVGVDRPIVVGILNVTPDSFSDGGRYIDTESAVKHVEEMVASGADMIDVGGESTRPGLPNEVSVEEEWRRLQPVLDYLCRTHPSLPLSVDTTKSEIAERALDVGVWAVNDVSALRLDPKVADVCAAFGSGLILSHSRGSFPEMAGYEHAIYADVTAETARELMAAVDLATDRGVGQDQLVIDPGIGFAKTPEQCCEVLRGLPFLASLGVPVMVGPSRKRFIGTITGKQIHNRDSATAAVCVAAFLGGAYLFRVHDVAGVKESLAVAEALRSK